MNCTFKFTSTLIYQKQQAISDYKNKEEKIKCYFSRRKVKKRRAETRCCFICSNQFYSRPRGSIVFDFFCFLSGLKKRRAETRCCFICSNQFYSRPRGSIVFGFFCFLGGLKFLKKRWLASPPDHGKSSVLNYFPIFHFHSFSLEKLLLIS